MCRKEAMKMGIEDIYFYEGDYSNKNLYGCFSKGIKAYWGNGGTDQDRNEELTGQKKRSE